MLGILLLVGFIKISIHYNNPVVLAGAYSVIVTLLSSAFGYELSTLLISGVLTFGIIWLFFWLLKRFEDTGIWWLVVILFPIGNFLLNLALQS